MGKEQMKTSREYQAFSRSMDTILKANPEAVKAAMDAEKRERAMEAERTGKRGRGRPPKSSSSDRAPSETD
jgi:AT hook motif